MESYPRESTMHKKGGTTIVLEYIVYSLKTKAIQFKIYNHISLLCSMWFPNYRQLTEYLFFDN